MDPSPLSPQTGLARQASETPGSQQAQAPAPGDMSGGTVTTEHIRWVTGLRAKRGRWSSEVQGPWTPKENAYFEFVYELFRSGLLGGVEAGLPLRFFMSELLGCEVKRIDQKLLNSRRSPEFGHPRCPSRKLGVYEHQVITSKLLLLEQAFLAREQNPLKDRVVFEGGDTAGGKGATRVADSRAPPGTAVARAAYVDPRMSSSASIAAAERGPPRGAGVAGGGGGAGVPQTNGRASGVVGAAAAACAAAAAESNGIPQSAPPTPAAASADQPAPAMPVARGLLAAALAGTEPVSRRPAAVTARSPAVAAAAAAAAAAAPASRRPAAPPPPAISHRFGDSTGRELGQKLLGVTRDVSGVSGAEEPRRQKQKTSTNSSSSSFPLIPASSGAAAAAAAGSASQARGRAVQSSWDGEVHETPEDVAAMEYLKWELHGKFMAFPGEDYHNLLANLASEIYHNRYPVEHGVDILHGVMREAGPEALQKCAATLKRMNLPPKMSL